MAHRGPAAVQIDLSADERAELERRAHEVDQRATQQRAQIVLACAEGMSNPQVARVVGVSPRTAGRWRAQFAAKRLAGPVGRSKAAVALSDDERAQLQRWARRGKTAQYLALRAKIVLRAADGEASGMRAID